MITPGLSAARSFAHARFVAVRVAIVLALAAAAVVWGW